MERKGVEARGPNDQKENARSKRNKRLSVGCWPLAVAFFLTGIRANQAMAGGYHKNSPSSSLKIVVRLYNQAQIPANTLQLAEGDVAQAVRPAGIDMSFVDCPITRERGPAYFACQQAAESRFVVKIIRLGAANYIRASSDTFGLALDCGPGHGPCMAYVFSDRIRDLTPKTSVASYVVLGRVLCHEIGHLLGLTHSEEGLMRADWTPRDFDPSNLSRVFFTPWDFQQIQARAATQFVK